MPAKYLRLKRKYKDTEPCSLPAIIIRAYRLYGCLKHFNQRMGRKPRRPCIHTIPIVIPRSPVYKRQITNRKHKQHKDSHTRPRQPFDRQEITTSLIQIFLYVLFFQLYSSLHSHNLPLKLCHYKILQIHEFFCFPKKQQKYPIKHHADNHEHQPKRHHRHRRHHDVFY